MTPQELEVLVKSISNKMRADDNTKLVTKYIEHLSWLLFLKVHEAMEDEAEILDPSFKRIIKGEYRWSVWAHKDWRAEDLIAFISGDLLPYLRALNTSTEGRLISTLFNGVSTIMKSGFGLKEVIGLVDKIDFHAPNEVHTFSVVYESLLARLGSEAGWSGEFYTPRPIVKLMVEIVSPRVGERIYDPAAGSAGFLVEAFEFLRMTERTIEDHELLSGGTFFGQDSGELPFLLGTMNLILHGVRAPNMVRRNTLEEDIRSVDPAKQYEVILTNPPFGGKENPQIQQNFPARSGATEVLFLQHVMALLKADGRAGIVVPDGILFREDGAFLHVRRNLVDNYQLEAIVRLPPGVFPYATATRTNLLFFGNGKPSEKIKFYRVSPAGVTTFGKTRPIRDEDLAGALAWIRDGVPDAHSWDVARDDIRTGTYDLDLMPPEEYQESDPEVISERLVGVSKTLQELTDELEPLRAMITDPTAYSFKTVESLAKHVEKRGRNPKQEALDRFIGVTNTGGLAPFKGNIAKTTSRYKRVEPGDFVYNPMRINVGSVALCRLPDESGWASPDYVVFRLREDSPLTPEFVLLYLQSSAGQHQIERNAQGSIRSRLYFKNLQDVKVPIPADPQAWDQLIAAWRVMVDLPRQALLSLEPALGSLFRWNTSPGVSVGQ